MKDLTLGLLYENGRILLGMKKRGFGEGRWNGFGGKVQEGETVEEAMMREYNEECGIGIEKYEKIGLIDFIFKNNPEILRVHIFKVLEYSGEPKESEEMRPQWFKINGIPYDAMWEDDRIWMPMFLEGKKFYGWVYFDESDRIIDHALIEADSRKL